MAGILPKRAGAKVPAEWLASAVALLQLAHREIRVTRAIVESLLEFFTWQWQLGHSPRQAVAMTCASGGTIQPSAGAYVDSREARPPKGAAAGAVEVAVPLGAGFAAALGGGGSAAAGALLFCVTNTAAATPPPSNSTATKIHGARERSGLIEAPTCIEVGGGSRARSPTLLEGGGRLDTGSARGDSAMGLAGSM